MFLRVKRHLHLVFPFLLASFFLLYLLLRNQEDSPSSNDVNVIEGSCSSQCSPCEHEPEIMDWDSSRVLRGPPTERFRGMLSHQQLTIQSVYIVLDNLRNDTRYLTTCAAAGFSMDFSIFNQT